MVGISVLEACESSTGHLTTLWPQGRVLEVMFTLSPKTVYRVKSGWRRCGKALECSRSGRKATEAEVVSGGALEKGWHGPRHEGPCRILDINSKGSREPLMALKQRSDLVRSVQSGERTRGQRGSGHCRGQWVGMACLAAPRGILGSWVSVAPPQKLLGLPTAVPSSRWWRL